MQLFFSSIILLNDLWLEVSLFIEGSIDLSGNSLSLLLDILLLGLDVVDLVVGLILRGSVFSILLIKHILIHFHLFVQVVAQ